MPRRRWHPPRGMVYPFGGSTCPKLPSSFHPRGGYGECPHARATRRHRVPGLGGDRLRPQPPVQMSGMQRNRNTEVNVLLAQIPAVPALSPVRRSQPLVLSRRPSVEGLLGGDAPGRPDQAPQFPMRLRLHPSEPHERWIR
jgi:hypothetical protein